MSVLHRYVCGAIIIIYLSICGDACRLKTSHFASSRTARLASEWVNEWMSECAWPVIGHWPSTLWNNKSSTQSHRSQSRSSILIQLQRRWIFRGYAVLSIESAHHVASIAAETNQHWKYTFFSIHCWRLMKPQSSSSGGDIDHRDQLYDKSFMEQACWYV